MQFTFYTPGAKALPPLQFSLHSGLSGEVSVCTFRETTWDVEQFLEPTEKKGW